MRETPQERSQRARVAAYTMHSKHDSRKITAPARAAALSRFEKQVDPDGILSPDERARRAEHARRAYFIGLARKSAQARKRGAA